MDCNSGLPPSKCENPWKLGGSGGMPPPPEFFFYVNPQNSPFPWIWDPFSWTLNPFFKVKKCIYTLVSDFKDEQVLLKYLRLSILSTKATYFFSKCDNTVNNGFLQLTEASIQSHPFHFLVKQCPAPFVFTVFVDFFAQSGLMSVNKIGTRHFHSENNCDWLIAWNLVSECKDEMQDSVVCSWL